MTAVVRRHARDGPRRSPRLRGVVRPVRPVVPLLSCATVVLAWQLVAHNSGAGWVQAVGDMLAGVLVVGLVAPAVACARARVGVVEGPTDSTAGLPVPLVVQSASRVRVRPLDPPGAESFVGPGRPVPVAGDAAGALGVGVVPAPRRRGEGEVALHPRRRGVHDDVLLEVASAAPFGILWWRRDVRVPLPRTLHVGPRLGEPMPLPHGAHVSATGATRSVPVPAGEPRAVRPYRAGDPRRFVHWPGTAHAGELMVREMERAGAEPVTVEVRLPPEEDAAEQMAERAMATVVTLVDRGAPVLLATTELDGAHLGPVGDRRSAGRRLARAVAEAHGSAGRTVARRTR
jgi:uncharacterized protein (DUF58 family)